VTLDDQSHELDSEMLLIADETQGIALAGVMGGLNTEINDQTVDVLLESACFHPGNIRRTSKLLDLRTDASYRFERGADVSICDWASRRAAQLILQTAGGELCQGAIDVYPGLRDPKTITLNYEKTNRLLGIEIPGDEQKKLLESIELSCVESTADSSKVQIPTFRVDLKGEIDLIEEVTRLYGVDRIPSTPPRGAHGENKFDSLHDQLMDARQLLTSLGASETQGQTLISDSAAKRVTQDFVALEHPLSSDMNVCVLACFQGCWMFYSTTSITEIQTSLCLRLGEYFYQVNPLLLSLANLLSPGREIVSWGFGKVEPRRRVRTFSISKDYWMDSWMSLVSGVFPGERNNARRVSSLLKKLHSVLEKMSLAKWDS
jgi:phenylalanyl-tRNA synthetase beta chain